MGTGIIMRTDRGRGLSAALRLVAGASRVRYFFHIVDKYRLSSEPTGCEYPHQDSVLHANRIAAEFAKAGEFFQSGFRPSSGPRLRDIRW
jgi:hypothetical protein